MLSFRSRRTAALFAAFGLLASPLILTSPVITGGALAQAAPKPAKELSVGQSAARERQKKCGAEWRALSVADKAAQGPKWPQYYSKCVKRLKQVKA
ncbi:MULTISPECIES: hypothetical protein [unclassified Methylobacterium]|uniref:hypothetical protein n=1 Tax=unclassified Methylobacterium TaxID=2615210 RepID=UPI0012E21B06|nr:MULTISPECIES: hypothetical protein [unclassified Methylobacterium]MCK2054562.1 hypothetical protein [Methylobacterium sp. 37f]